MSDYNNFQKISKIKKLDIGYGIGSYLLLNFYLAESNKIQTKEFYLTLQSYIDLLLKNKNLGVVSLIESQILFKFINKSLKDKELKYFIKNNDKLLIDISKIFYNKKEYSTYGGFFHIAYYFSTTENNKKINDKFLIPIIKESRNKWRLLKSALSNSSLSHGCCFFYSWLVNTNFSNDRLKKEFSEFFLEKIYSFENINTSSPHFFYHDSEKNFNINSNIGYGDISILYTLWKNLQTKELLRELLFVIEKQKAKKRYPKADTFLYGTLGIDFIINLIQLKMNKNILINQNGYVINRENAKQKNYLGFHEGTIASEIISLIKTHNLDSSIIKTLYYL